MVPQIFQPHARKYILDLKGTKRNNMLNQNIKWKRRKTARKSLRKSDNKLIDHENLLDLDHDMNETMVLK